MKQKMTFGKLSAASTETPQNLINQVSDKSSFNEQRISCDLLVTSPYNEEYAKDMSKKDIIKDSIRKGGLYTNLVVKPIKEEVNGITVTKYRIVAGETRYHAIIELIEEGDNRYKNIPCNVLNENITMEDEKRILDEINILQRDYTPEFKRKKIESLQKEYINSDEDVNPVKKAAEVMGITVRQVQRYNKINNNLIPVLQKALDQEQISVEKAAQCAGLDEDVQEMLAGLLSKHGNMSNSEIDHARKEALALKDALKKVEREKEQLQINLENTKTELLELKTQEPEVLNNSEQQDIEKKAFKDKIKELEKEKKEAAAELKKQKMEAMSLQKNIDEMKSSSINIPDEEKQRIKDEIELQTIVDEITRKINMIHVKLESYRKSYGKEYNIAELENIVKL